MRYNTSFTDARQATYPVPSILCLDPSVSYGSLLSRIAADLGLAAQTCTTVEDAEDRMRGQEEFRLLVVANILDAEDNGIDFIRRCRLLPHRMTVPIIFVMSDRDLLLANLAMQTGATEVVMRSDSEELTNLVGDLSRYTPTAGRTGRALLVEDSESESAYIREICTLLGLDVDRCASVDEGKVMLATNEYQVAIIDIVLLGLQSGLALVRHIRRLSPPASALPVFVISGFADVARRLEMFRLGVDDFLSKPFTEDEFVWRLRRVLQADTDNQIHAANEPAKGMLTWKQYGMSPRECEIANAIVQGDSDRKIAADHCISYWTVRTHIGRIFNKVGVLNRRELMSRFLRPQ
jgi:DNA-binding NarL/FixJ family response regulator